MKTIVILCDGMADYPVPELDGKTPLEVSLHPNMDKIAGKGVFGLARTVPEGMHPGSDNANLSVFGYDPHIYYTGRSPLEAVNIGIDLDERDVAYRCNLVTLSGLDEITECIMHDYSAGEISTEESRQLIEYMNDVLGNDFIELHTGISYRHCLVMRDSETGAILTPPHDISGKPVAEYLPDGENSLYLYSMMRRSYELLKEHPINKKRVAEGKNPANCLWFWGEGRKPALTPYKEKFGIEKGGVISAVDLIRGIGICAGLDILKVDGNVTGTFETDYLAKAKAAVKAFKDGYSFVYLHIEAADECGHHGQLKEKIECIADIDSKVIAPVMEYLEKCGDDYSVLIMPDHPTPMVIKTHSADPVPFAMYSSKNPPQDKKVIYTEKNAADTGVFYDEAHELMQELLK